MRNKKKIIFPQIYGIILRNLWNKPLKNNNKHNIYKQTFVTTLHDVTVTR